VDGSDGMEGEERVGRNFGFGNGAWGCACLGFSEDGTGELDASGSWRW
jgi:hypothetical protein